MGQKTEAGLGIMDSQSVRWGDNRSLKGVDGNKKVKGGKRHVVVDKNGFLLAVMATIACVHDSRAAYLLARYLGELCCNIEVILADAGYRGEIVGKIRTAFGNNKTGCRFVASWDYPKFCVNVKLQGSGFYT